MFLKVRQERNKFPKKSHKKYREKLKGDPDKKAACSAKAKLRVEKSRALKRKLQNQSQRLNSSF